MPTSADKRGWGGGDGSNEVGFSDIICVDKDLFLQSRKEPMLN